jgi:Txe/YoeB family toxin of Txe-Axe toxin-antitoxin module
VWKFQFLIGRLKTAKKVRNKAESIVKDLGLEPIFIPIRQMLLQGAMLSCLVARLNWQDRIAYLFWKEGMADFS